MKVVDEGIIWYIYITCYVLLMPYLWAGMTFLPQLMISVMFPVTILYSVCKRSIGRLASIISGGFALLQPAKLPLLICSY